MQRPLFCSRLSLKYHQDKARDQLGLGTIQTDVQLRDLGFRAWGI